MKPRPALSGDVIEVMIETLAYGGEGIARHQGLAIFVPESAPGDRLLVRIVETKKRFARAVIEKIIEPAAIRREPKCRYFGACGGCQLQHISYAAQLEAKSAFIRDSLNRIGGIGWKAPIIIRHAQEFHYRTRAQVKLDWPPDNQPLKRVRIGFNRLNSHSVCDVESCPILVPELDAALSRLRGLIKQGAGAELEGRDKTGLTEIEMVAGTTGVTVQPGVAGLQSGTVETTVRGLTYRISPTAFFQSNRFLLEELVQEAVGESRGAFAVDLYAGAGLFTLHLAKLFDRVTAVESDARAAQLARENLLLNRIENVQMLEGRVEEVLARLPLIPGTVNRSDPDLLVLNPPRTGAIKGIAAMIDLRPSRISYVSCDPATLSRDLRVFIESGYELSQVTGFDLFPQTYHVETVAKLRLAGTLY